MKKLMYLLLGAASVIIYKAFAESEAEKGSLPRPVPKTFDSTIADEVAGPIGEV